MLSRAAERAYWAGRYLERAESTARIVQQYSQLLLDLPDDVGVGWDELATIFGAGGYAQRQAQTQGAVDGDRTDAEADSVLAVLVSDPNSPASLACAIRMARDNVRNTRDLLPMESWENINELYQFSRSDLAEAMRSEDRFEVLSDCIARCQQIDGILGNTMSHGYPYQFMLLGQCLERADMTSRIVDVATAHVRKDPELVARFGSVLGTHALKTVSGFQMYRQYCQPRVEGPRVIEFLVRDEQFPRAISFNLARARGACRALPRGEVVEENLARLVENLARDPDSQLSARDVSEIMDRVQKRLAEVNTAVVDTWFRLDRTS